MENNNNNNNKKKLTWAVGLIAGLGILSIAYAALSSTLNIKGENASVNVGYVRFMTTDEGSDMGCQALGIGSTNPEYGDKESNESTITGRSGSDKGMIKSAEFAQPWARALAEPGTLTVGTSDSGKAKDIVTISGTKLNDYGSFVVYKLDIKNDAANAMKLAKAPTVDIYELSSDSDTEGTKYTGDLIQAKVYSEYFEDNFVKDTCVNEVAAFTGTSYPASSFHNYLTAGGTTNWYLKVSFKEYGENTNQYVGTMKFKFVAHPQWEAVM